MNAVCLLQTVMLWKAVHGDILNLILCCSRSWNTQRCVWYILWRNLHFLISTQEQGVGCCGYVTHMNTHSQPNWLQIQYL